MRRRQAFALAAGVLLAAVCPIVSDPKQAAADGRTRITLPPLSGRYPVGTIDLHLVDTRNDPWRAGEPRELMVTVAYPAQPGGTRAAWVSEPVAAVLDRSAPESLDIPADTVDWAYTRRHAVEAAAVDDSGPWPLVLFSPGLGSPRELNTVRVDDLASYGYVVVSISHTGDAEVVEFPDGRLVTGIPDRNQTYVETALDTRITDTQFVLDAMNRLRDGENPDAGNRSLPTGLAEASDLDKVGMFGHSLGGYTAGEVMCVDPRVRAGVNLDGGMALGRLRSITEHGVDRPFMLIGSDPIIDPASGRTYEHSHATPQLDWSWTQFWLNQRAWKRDLHFHNSSHYSFTDLQAVIPQLAELISPKACHQMVGSIDPTESLQAQSAYLTAFFDLHLNQVPTTLFDTNSPDYPDVRFVS
ncbi:alpha/beta hydrolase family protein [Nocardia sp. NPDC020380]|uniref:alpha/beta hydrolase family protein n=1 Tax=Nocardia sp. NPDC020380 TaxID=3364309 RepID=UPI00379B92AE